MSTTVSPPSKSPRNRNATVHALLAILTDPRQVGPWLVVTPNWLRAAMVAMVLLSTAFALAIRHAALEQSQTIKTIQKDSAPSIVAGQGMRASLADMHSNLANELLVKPGQGKQALTISTSGARRRPKACSRRRGTSPTTEKRRRCGSS